MNKTQDKYMSTVKVGPKGQIVIPKVVRDMFDIEPGDMLLLMADAGKGVAIHKAEVFSRIAEAIFEGKGKDIYPNESEDHLSIFAGEIKNAVEKPDEDDEV